MSILARRIRRLEAAIPPPPPPPPWEDFDSYRNARDPDRVTRAFLYAMIYTPWPPPHWRKYDDESDRRFIPTCSVFRRWIGQRMARLDAMLSLHGEGILDAYDRRDLDAIPPAAAEACHHLFTNPPNHDPEHPRLRGSEYEHWLLSNGYTPDPIGESIQ